ncbi:helix-turn-helix transcriptional regulator [Rummeliibacillus stabekisii]|uniref:helix-turn-helix domain-containing protein n=1 Tax=Rummeliibacillus stabekisii TaxID=241244 RepID=UPI002042689E|nr:helix-turn-helix transcriptional regulator [Rummeliibacillus stabekisii]MCM3316149.1 helix-turn-helix transcriptional regulator [Rummeliibacillus stabekisii]
MNSRKWLKTIRIEKGMTQQRVSERANIERSYYTMIEQGKRTPSVKVAKDIAEVLGFDWTIFFETKCNEMKHFQTA